MCLRVGDVHVAEAIDVPCSIKIRTHSIPRRAISIDTAENPSSGLPGPVGRHSSILTRNIVAKEAVATRPPRICTQRTLFLDSSVSVRLTEFSTPATDMEEE